MKIVVIGGTGLIGSKTVARLRAKGHDVLAASPNSGVNTITGEGLAEALTGCDVVLDLANSPSFEDKAVLEFFETAGHNLLAAEAKAGVKHHIALSIVGTERLPESGCMRAKLVQEKLIKASPIPYTIVHPRSSSNSCRALPMKQLPVPSRGSRLHLSSLSHRTTLPMPWPTLSSAGRSTARSRLRVPSALP
jgi:hypothetical protein